MTTTARKHPPVNGVALDGTGVHTGQPVRLVVERAAAGTGIRFLRQGITIAARVENVTSTERRIQLGAAGVTVDTVEHLLAATHGLGLDDLLVHVDGPELPIGDGSAGHYVDTLTCLSELQPASAPPPAWVCPPPFGVSAGGAMYRYEPHDELILDVQIEFDHALIGTQRFVYNDRDSFQHELAGARTFVTTEEVNELRNANLIKGGTLDCAVVLEGKGLARGALRWPDEFVRHKTLDLLGDLRLLGRRCTGRITATRPGHAGNITLVKALLERLRESTA